MKAYLNPFNDPVIWFAALFGSAATIFLVYLLAKGLDFYLIMAPMIGYLIAGAIFFDRGEKFLDYHRTMKRLQTEGRYEALNLEFGKTKALMNYKLRFGTQHLFVKGSGVIVSYGDIKTLSLKKMTSESGRKDIRVSIRTPYGTIPLGVMAYSAIKQGALDQLVCAIREKNASVLVLNG